MGDYNSAMGKQLVITFEVCRDPEGTPAADKKCRDEAFIMNWIRRKFLITLENQVEFNK